jgi:FixJ family two-component response regulator
VLLVDDEDLVRSSVRTFLEDKGLKVVDTVNPREAIRIADELGDKLGMLITDVIMPELTGTELARTLLSKHPSLSVIFMSGYAAGANHQEFPTAKFLQKPFNRATLIDAVCSSSKCKNMSQGAHSLDALSPDSERCGQDGVGYLLEIAVENLKK